MAITGTVNNDVRSGGPTDDTFKLYQGGDDTATGGAGDDLFVFASTFTAADSVDGGADNDKLVLSGDYSAGVVFAAATLTNVETLRVQAGFDYDLTSHDGTVAASSLLTVDGGGLGAGDGLTFDGSAETDGTFKLIGGAGDDMLTGGAGGDLFSIAKGGSDTANGGGGNDTFAVGANFNAADTIDGGAGTDTLTLNGDYSSGLGLGNVTNVEVLRLTAGNSYDLTGGASMVSGSLRFQLSAASLGAGDAVTFTAAGTGGHYDFTMGAGNDTLTGGVRSDVLNLSKGGNDTANGGGGADIFSMGGALTAADKLDGGAGNDTLVMDGDYSAILGALTFNATTMTSVETIRVAAGNSYTFSIDDGNAAGTDTVMVDGSALGASDKLFIAATNETTARYDVTGGAAADLLYTSGGDTFHGGDGDDGVGAFSLVGSTFLDGGAGNDVLGLLAALGTSGSPFTLTGSLMTSIETLVFSPGGATSFLNVDDTLLGSGATLTVTGFPGLPALASTGPNAFDGSAETDGHFAFVGGTGNDVLTGGAQSDTFDLSHGGNDTATGGNGNDTFAMGAAFTGADNIDGGAGNDTLDLSGQDGGDIVFTSMTNVETLMLHPGTFFFGLETVDANVGAGQTLTVDGSTLGATNQISFDGSAELDGSFAITGGAANDSFVGGDQNDTFDLSYGGNDFVDGGGGDDTITMGAALTAADTIDGGAGGNGNDELLLLGDYAAGVTFTATTLVNVGFLTVSGAFDYNFTTNDANVAAGGLMGVDGSGIAAGHSLIWDGSAETDGEFELIGGAGDDHLTGGAGDEDIGGGDGDDHIDLSMGGDDAANGGNDDDTFTMGAAFTSADSIDGEAGNDTLELSGVGSSDILFTAGSMRNIETLKLNTGGGYDITTVDLNVGSGQTLTVDASGLLSTEQLVFNGAAELDGRFVITGGADSDFLTGGGGNDTLDGGAGTDTLNGGVNDFSVTPAAANDVLIGGADTDTFRFEGRFGDDAIGTSVTADWVDGEQLIFVGYGSQTPIIVDDGLGNVVITIDDGSVSSSVTIYGASASQFQSQISGADLILS